VKITLKRQLDFRVFLGKHHIGSVTKYGDTWSANSRDEIGNIYGQGSFKTKKEAIKSIKKWISWNLPKGAKL
jgi:hypothetical protein